MRTILTLFILSWTSLLTACGSISNNTIPENGPTMEQVYDGMNSEKNKKYAASEISYVPEKSIRHPFHKLANPELHMLVFPHLAGKEEVPIPAYETEFNAYPKDHYALPNETIRE